MIPPSLSPFPVFPFLLALPLFPPLNPAKGLAPQVGAKKQAERQVMHK